MSRRPDIGISSTHYHLPKTRRSLDELAAGGQLTSSVAALKRFGFRRVHVAQSAAHELARESVEGLLREFEIDPESVDHLIVATALPRKVGAVRNPLSLFSYPATRLQSELGFRNAVVTATHQAGCVGLFTALQLARMTLQTDARARRIVCVGSDVLPATSRREILYNVISDGACAFLVEKDATRNRIVSHAQATRGFFWTPKAREHELIASYFPMARRVIEQALGDANLRASDVALVLPHNVNRRSWEILLDLVGIDETRLYDRNIARKGHTVAADPFINLQDATEEGRVQRGDRLLLFSFGFGAHWACTILEH